MKILIALIITLFLAGKYGLEIKQPVSANRQISNKFKTTGFEIIGIASYYSETGCLGCNKNLITASGEKLSDTEYTLAFNHLPMGTIVKITNTRNNKSVIAKVNDRGGFEKYNRIADLSLATKNAIDLRTDKDVIIIKPLWQ